jgi:hypothetical protein
MIKVDLSGFDKLQKQLDEVKQALSALDGQLAVVNLNADPVQTQRAIHEMEAAIDARVEQYRGNPLVEAFAKAAKDHFRERILESASALRNSDSHQLDNHETGENVVNPVLELKRKQRLEFMNSLYEMTNGNEHEYVDMAKIGMGLSFTKEETYLAVQYLAGEGLLKYVTLDGGVSITHLGVAEVESALLRPDKPTEHFPPAQNIIQIETMTHSVIQQGNINSNQTVSFETNELEAIRPFLEAFALQLPKLQIGGEEKEEAQAEIDTANVQLKSPKPKPQIIATCLKTLLSIVEKVGTAALTSDVTAHLSAIHAIMRRIGM